MRHAHVCPHCDHRSTRWWNLKVHIKRRHGRFLLGRSSDSNPVSPNDPYHNIGTATVADSVGNSFEPTYLRHRTSDSYERSSSQYSSSLIHRPLSSMDDQSYGTSLSQETIVKLTELKRLVYKYTQFHNNDPDEIVRLVVYYCINGDNTLLDQKLAQLHRLDSLANNNF